MIKEGLVRSTCQTMGAPPREILGLTVQPGVGPPDESVWVGVPVGVGVSADSGVLEEVGVSVGVLVAV